MTFFKRTNIEQNEITKATLDETNKIKPKKIFKRQNGQSPHSNDSRKSLNRIKHSLPNTFIPFIKITRESEPMQTSYTDRPDYSGGFITSKNAYTSRKQFSDRNKMLDLAMQRGDPLSRRVEHLEEQLELKNRELELVSEDRESLKVQNKQLEQKCSFLERTNRTQNRQIEQGKQNIRKLTIENRKLESEKVSLNKKIDFLQKFNFSTDTKNLQSLRQNHLQKQIEILKQKLKAEGGHIEYALQQQYASQRQQLFSAKRLIESLQINNSCLQRKIQQNGCFIFNEDDYVSLRKNYKKFLIEYKEMRKSFDNLQKQNQMLRSKQMANSCSEDFSLELSLFSALNN